MTSQGPYYAGTISEDTFEPYDDNAWSDEAYVGANDGNYATILQPTFDAGDYSYRISCSDFGFTIPTDATIDGVEVRIGRYYANGIVRDAYVCLFAEAVRSSNKASGTNWPTSEAEATYGGPTDKWDMGAALTPTNVNSTLFYIFFACLSTENDGDAYVDYINITIYYTEAGGATNLVVADATHVHAIEAPTLTQVHVLTAVDSATHGHPVDNAILQIPIPTVDSIAHVHAIEVPAITSITILAPADATHAHAVDQAGLEQTHILASVDSATHAHTAEQPLPTQIHVLVVAESLHGHTVEEPTLQVAVTLAVDSIAHGHSVDGLTLTQLHVLQVDGALHGHAADAPVLTQLHVLTVDSAMHTHLVDAPVLTQVHILTVDGALHGHTVEEPTLEGAVTLVVQDATHAHPVAEVVFGTDLVVDSITHGHVVDQPILTQLHVLSVDSITHSHSVEAPVVTQTHVLVVDSAVHVTTSEVPTPIASDTLVVAECRHLTYADEVGPLTQLHVLVVDGALHTHSVEDGLVFSHVYNLSVDSLLHGQTAEEPKWADNLVIADATHGHTVDQPTLTQVHTLIVDSILHAQAADGVDWRVGEADSQWIEKRLLKVR